MVDTVANAGTVRAVTRALRLLDFLGNSQSGLALTQLSEETHLNSSTAHRLLSTMIGLGYVRQDPRSKKYLLGPSVLHLGQVALAHFDIRSEALGPLRWLAAEVKELANLALLTGNEATYVAQAPGDRFARMFTSLGARVPLYCTGVGKAIMAFMPPAELQAVLNTDPLNAYTVNTITNVLSLRHELEMVRQQMYAVDNEEREVGIRCVAAPIFGPDGAVIAAISVSGPSGRITPARDEEIGRVVKLAATEISDHFGYRPDGKQG